MTEPHCSGELLVQNGTKAGAKLPLTGAVTLIGAGDRCDVRLTGPGVADLHCLIADTPAGPVLRSWAPDRTLVNGAPTAAALLRHGDEVRVGPCRFRLAWAAEDIIPLEPGDLVPLEPGDLVPLDPAPGLLLPEGVSYEDLAAYPGRAAALADTAWQIQAREHALDAQETELVAALDDRRRKLAAWVRDLTAGREQLRREKTAGLAAERAKVRAQRAKVRPLYRAAKAERARARVLVQRFLAHMKRRWAAERRAAEATRADLDRGGRHLDTRAADLRLAEARFGADVAAGQRRLREAWDVLAAGQARLVADRAAAEQAGADRLAAVAARETAVAAREEAAAGTQERAETRVKELLAEAGRLDTRAAHARAVLGELEGRRAKLETDLSAAAAAGAGVGAVVAALADLAPLDRRADVPADQLLGQLRQRELDLGRERQALVKARAEVDRRAAALADERAVLAEQVAALAAVRDGWRDAEHRAALDLEAAARAVLARESALDLRGRELAAADTRRRLREADLHQFQTHLDGWHASLAAHEATAAAARDRADIGLAAKRDQLGRWEAALTTLCRKWGEARRADRLALGGEVGRWAAARARYELKLADLDRKRLDVLGKTAALAERALAVEQAEAALASGEAMPSAFAGRRGGRRLRVLRRKWAAPFRRLVAELDARRAAAAAEGVAADARIGELHRVLGEAAEATAGAAAAGFAAEAGQLARDRAEAERAVVLSIETARRERTERELVRARAEVERVAAAVMAAPGPGMAADVPPPGVIALRAA